MKSHGITRIIAFNIADFAHYKDIQAAKPQ
jgi:hypothetical protein